MSEEQNHANDALAAIQKEIKDMRAEAEAQHQEIKDMRAEAEAQHQEIKDKTEDMGDDAEVHYKDSLYFAGYVLSVGVGLVGVSFWLSLTSPLCPPVCNAYFLMLLGGLSAAYFFCKGKKLRKKHKQRKARSFGS